MKLPLFVPFALLVSAPVLAQSTAIDVNADGQYSLAEIQAALPDFDPANFDALDTNADGRLDAAEIAAGVAAGLLPN